MLRCCCCLLFGFLLSLMPFLCCSSAPGLFSLSSYLPTALDATDNHPATSSGSSHTLGSLLALRLNSHSVYPLKNIHIRGSNQSDIQIGSCSFQVHTLVAHCIISKQIGSYLHTDRAVNSACLIKAPAEVKEIDKQSARHGTRKLIFL